MERLEPYKGFQIRAYQEWSGQWLAEARKAGINRPDADYIATPSGHPTPEAAINFIKQMIDKQMIDEDALARLTRPGGEEIIETLYGINPKTFEVETVSLNRGVCDRCARLQSEWCRCRRRDRAPSHHGASNP